MQKTVISHFYNEEHLLPWWLTHHKQIFDHGIMIDYYSTDRSMEIIREICPDWELRYTRNRYFDSTPIDQEVMDIERGLEGWRMCLNTTEFLYGNVAHMDERTDPIQYFIGNYVFVDMEDETKGPLVLSHDRPLHEQRYWGYNDTENRGIRMPGGSMHRMNRSLHNYAVRYDGGRHWPNSSRSFEDLVIFYYGYADISAAGIKRKVQIQSKISEKGHPHSYDEQGYLGQYRVDQQPKAQNLKEQVDGIYELQQRSIANKSIIVDEPKQAVEEPPVQSKIEQPPPRTVG